MSYVHPSPRCVSIPFPSDIPSMPPLPVKGFVVIAHRARSDGRFPLDDLCGASGRWDGLIRCVTAALLISHGIREDTAVHLVLNGPGDPPRTLTLMGSEARRLNPDERSTAALMKKALERPPPAPPDVLWAGYGTYVRRGGLSELIDGWDGRLYLLDEKGRDGFLGPEALDLQQPGLRRLFVLSDDQDLSPEEEALVTRKGAMRISLSPVTLHSYQVIINCHLLLDRSTLPKQGGFHMP